MKLKDSIIIILLVVIAIVVGVFLGVKITEGKNDNVNPEINKNNDKEIENEFSVTEAKKIMDKYLVFSSYISDLTNEDEKSYIAIQNTKNNETYSCKKLFGNNYFEPEYNAFLVRDLHYCTKESRFYDYSNVLSTKKELFGKTSILNNDDFDYQGTFIYNKKNSLIISVFPLVFGIDGFPVLVENNIDYAKTYDNKLEIGITENITRIINPDTEETQTTVEKRTYIFIKEDNHYYLAEINKK